MNASQRRIAFRSQVRALSNAGILPGVAVARKAPGKKEATEATIVGIVQGSAKRLGKDVHAVARLIPGNGRALLCVRRKDNRTTLWPLHEARLSSAGPRVADLLAA